VNFPIEYSDKLMTPFGGMALMKRFIGQVGIREYHGDLDLPQPGSTRLAVTPVRKSSRFPCGRRKPSPSGNRLRIRGRWRFPCGVDADGFTTTVIVGEADLDHQRMGLAVDVAAGLVRAIAYVTSIPAVPDE
jgi:hypothetical protein